MRINTSLIRGFAIDFTQLSCQDVNNSKTAYNFARNASEVLIFGYIPPEAIEVYAVNNGVPPRNRLTRTAKFNNWKKQLTVQQTTEPLERLVKVTITSTS